jgi:signal transduction histidine kinase
MGTEGEPVSTHGAGTRRSAGEAVEFSTASRSRLRAAGIRLPRSRYAVNLALLWAGLVLRLRLGRRPRLAVEGVRSTVDPRALACEAALAEGLREAMAADRRLAWLIGLVGTRHALGAGAGPQAASLVAAAADFYAGYPGDVALGFVLARGAHALSARFAEPGGSAFGLPTRPSDAARAVQAWEQDPRSRDGPSDRYARGVSDSRGARIDAVWHASGRLDVLSALLAPRQAGGPSGHAATDSPADAAYRRLMCGLVGDPASHATAGSADPVAPAAPPSGWRDAYVDVIQAVAFGRVEPSTLAVARALRQGCLGPMAMLVRPALHWYCLIAAVEASRSTSGGARAALRVRRDLRRIERWAAQAGGEFEHRVLASRAELAALRGDPSTALGLYDRATEVARRLGLLGDAALIAARAATFAKRSRHLAARRLAASATVLVGQWGAPRLAAHLEGDLRIEPAGGESPRAIFDVDAATLTDSLQAINGEVDPDRVAGTLLALLLTHTGSHYGALLVTDGTRLRIVSQRTQSPELLVAPTDVDLDRSGLPIELVETAFADRRTLRVTDHRLDGERGAPGRWGGRVGVALVCSPLVSAGGARLGVAYLESDVGEGAFESGRLRFVEVLCAQAATSIANARLFSEIEASRRDLETLNSALERRVEERSNALERNFVELAKLERKVIADAERNRLIRDLHDGLGSQLFATMRLVERNETDHDAVLKSIRECISDMRLVLDAAGSDAADALDAWYSFRARWAGQLVACGLEAHWAIELDRDGAMIEPHLTLNLMRIAQESLTNVIRHACARTVRVNLRSDGRAVHLVVEDDGAGFEESPSPGRGLSNMRQRAATIGATLLISPVHPGTRIDVRCPIVT